MTGYIDRAAQITGTPGTGSPLMLSGAAVSPYQTWPAAGAVDGETYDYVILDPMLGSAWEICHGVYSSAGPSITRITDASSAGGAPLNLSGGAYISQEVCARTLNGLIKSIFPVCIRPVDAAFTWLNQGSAQLITNDDGSQTLINPADGAVQLRGRIRAIPGSTYTITVGYNPIYTNVNFQNGILALYDGTKVYLFGEHRDTGNNLLWAGRWNSVTSFSASDSLAQLGSWNGPKYVRVKENGTNRIMQIGDGKTFYTVKSEASNNFLTPTHCGFVQNNQNGTFQSLAQVFHYEQSTP